MYFLCILKLYWWCCVRVSQLWYKNIQYYHLLILLQDECQLVNQVLRMKEGLKYYNPIYFPHILKINWWCCSYRKEIVLSALTKDVERQFNATIMNLYSCIHCLKPKILTIHKE